MTNPIYNKIRVQFEDGPTVEAVIRDTYIDFEGTIESIPIPCTQIATETIKRHYPTAKVFIGERRLA